MDALFINPKIWDGIHNQDHCFRLEYIEEYALCDLPGYYLHRARYKGDKLKNQHTDSGLPILKSNIILGGKTTNLKVSKDEFYRDVTIHHIFKEAISFLGEPYRFDRWHSKDFDLLCIKREREERRVEIEVEQLKEYCETGQMSLFFDLTD